MPEELKAFLESVSDEVAMKIWEWCDNARFSVVADIEDEIVKVLLNSHPNFSSNCAPSSAFEEEDEVEDKCLPYSFFRE